MKSPKVILRELAETDEAAFFEGLKTWEGEDLTWYTFDWKPGMTYPQMLEKLRNNARGIGLPAGFVPATMLYGFVDGAIIGRVSIRHALNGFLKLRGGHIGYSVAPQFRGRGYASEMMKLSLDYCRTELRITDLLVTCDDANTASWKIIERFGGVLENKITDPAANKLVRRYWIKLS